MHIKIQNEVRNKFKSLQAEQNPGAMIEYLSSLLQTENADTLFTGFCYWNISDSFAMLRNSDALYKNHCEFAKFLSDKPSKYLLWLACDAAGSEIFGGTVIKPL